MEKEAGALEHLPPSCATKILSLDDATSSVNSEIETQIQRALEELMRGRTSLVIAHHLSTVQNADRIIVMHNGELWRKDLTSSCWSAASYIRACTSYSSSVRAWPSRRWKCCREYVAIGSDNISVFTTPLCWR